MLKIIVIGEVTPLSLQMNLQVMYREPDIVTTMEVRRLERTGRVVRIFDGRTVKKVFWGIAIEEGKQEDQNQGGWTVLRECSEVDGCQEMEEGNRHNRMFCLSEGNTG